MSSDTIAAVATAVAAGEGSVSIVRISGPEAEAIGERLFEAPGRQVWESHRVLYGHVFRNAMLIVIAGFPSAFIGILFTGALLTEVIFSLDGLGLLGFEAVVKRDYPLMFGTLYFFTLLGLLMGIIGDIMYHIVDPRIDFEARDV